MFSSRQGSGATRGRADGALVCGLRRWIRVARRWSPGVRFLAGSSYSLGGVSCLPVRLSSLLSPVVLDRRRSRLSPRLSVPSCASALASRSVVPGALTLSFSQLSLLLVVFLPPFRSSPWVGPRVGASGVGLLLLSSVPPPRLARESSGARVALSLFRSPVACALARPLVFAPLALSLLLVVVVLSLLLFRAAFPPRVCPGLPPVCRCALVCPSSYFRLLVLCPAFLLSAVPGFPPVPAYGRVVNNGFPLYPPWLGASLPGWAVLAAACPVFFGSLLSASAPDAGYVACGLQASNTVTRIGLSPISRI